MYWTPPSVAIQLLANASILGGHDPTLVIRPVTAPLRAMPWAVDVAPPSSVPQPTRLPMHSTSTTPRHADSQAEVRRRGMRRAPFYRRPFPYVCIRLQRPA